MIRFTKEEMTALARFEMNFQCALSDYLRSVGRQGVELMREVYKKHTGEDFRRTDACGHCELDLTRWIAARYFDTKNNPEPKKEAEPKAEPKKKTSKTSKK